MPQPQDMHSPLKAAERAIDQAAAEARLRRRLPPTMSANLQALQIVQALTSGRRPALEVAAPAVWIEVVRNVGKQASRAAVADDDMQALQREVSATLAALRDV